MSINYQIIGKQIREIRKREKFSQEKLAERSELSTQYISQIETAARRASLTSLVNIAGALNVGIEELLYGNIPIRPSECQKETAQIFRDCTIYEKQKGFCRKCFPCPKIGTAPLRGCHRSTGKVSTLRKMDKLHREFPKIIRLKSWTEVSKTYVLPKNLVRIGKPRVLSKAQLRHLKELRSRA